MKAWPFIVLGLCLLQGCASLSQKVGNRDFAPEEGLASWYGADKSHIIEDGGPTASGERYDMYDLTAAHKTLPMGTMVKVTNLENGRTVIVRINDRGPYIKGRIIDLSLKAARIIGIEGKGTAKVRIEPAG